MNCDEQLSFALCWSTSGVPHITASCQFTTFFFI
jgi:hypothetical protein